MDNFQIGYHCATIDCEGCIAIGRRKEDKGYTYQVSVGNTNLLLLDYLKSTSGIGTITPKQAKNSEKHKNYWMWLIKPENIKNYLLQIKDFLILKKEQAILMLEFIETIEGHNYHRFNRVPENIKILREVIFQEMKELNRKGPSNE